MPISAEQLIDSGIEIPTDPVEIALLLDGDGAKPAAEEVTDEPTATPDKPDEDAAAKAAAAKAAEAKAAEEAAAAKPSADPDAEEEEKGAPRALIRNYRERLHESEEELEAAKQREAAAAEREKALAAELELLKTKVESGQQVLQEEADKLKVGVDLAKITPQQLEELRKHHDDDLVDLIAGLAKGHEQLAERLQTVSKENEQLVEEREHVREQRVFDEIDSVPLLGVLRLSKDDKADERWERVSKYHKAVLADPDWAGKPRKEVLAEVGRRMEGFLGKDTVGTLLADRPTATRGAKPAASPEKVLSEALARAEKAAVPVSLSEIPASGGAVAQDTLQRVEAMSMDDLAGLMDSWVAGGKAPDDLLARLLSAN